MMTQRWAKKKSGGIFGVSVCDEFLSFNWTGGYRRWRGKQLMEREELFCLEKRNGGQALGSRSLAADFGIPLRW